MKLPAIAGMEDFAGHSFHTARLGLRVHRRRPGRAAHESARQGRRPDRHGRHGDPGLARVGRVGRPRLRVPAHAVGHRRARQPADRTRVSRRRSSRAGSGIAWTTSKRRCSARQVDADLTDDGWTHHYAKVQNAPRWKGMTYEEYMRNAEEIDFEIMEEHRRRVDELVNDPAKAAILKPYYRYLCKRPCFHDEYLDAYNNDNVTLVDCPSGLDRVTAPRAGGRRQAVRVRLHRLRHRVSKPSSRRCTRKIGHDLVGRDGVTPRREVGGRRADALRHDEPRVPEHVHHAGAGAAVGRHRQLHAPRGGRRRVRRWRGRRCSKSGA